MRQEVQNMTASIKRPSYKPERTRLPSVKGGTGTAEQGTRRPHNTWSSNT